MDFVDFSLFFFSSFIIFFFSFLLGEGVEKKRERREGEGKGEKTRNI